MKLAAAALVVLVVACQGTLIAPTDCGEIPSGGCLDKGDSVDQCGDVSCVALYTCIATTADGLQGAWQHGRDCPARAPGPDAGPVDAGATDADADAGPLRDANALPDDLPPGATGGPGCVDLQLPDCPLAVGYGCPSDCCGCEALFVCNAGGWDPWGTCENDVPTATTP